MSHRPAFLLAGFTAGEEVLVSGLDQNGKEHAREKMIIYHVTRTHLVTTLGLIFNLLNTTDVETTGNNIPNMMPTREALLAVSQVETETHVFLGLENFGTEPE